MAATVSTSRLSTPVPMEVTQSTSFPGSLSELRLLPKPFPETVSCVQLAQTPDGKRWVVKWNEDLTYVAHEHVASKAYAALGLPVVTTKVYKGTFGEEESSFLVMPYLEGAQDFVRYMTGDPLKDAPYLEQIEKSFIAVCLVGAWDISGLNFNNLMVDASGNVVYVDYGLSLGRNYDGTHKSDMRFVTGGNLLRDVFGVTQQAGETNEQYTARLKDTWWSNNPEGIVPEIIYLRDPTDRLATAYIYQGITAEKIQEQINALDPNLTELRDLVTAGEFPEEVFTNLLNRVRWLKSLSLAQLRAFEGLGGENSLRNKLEARRRAVEAAGPDGIPLFKTFGIEPKAAARFGTCFSSLPDNVRTARPAQEKALCVEANRDEIWVSRDPASGALTLPSWKVPESERGDCEYLWPVNGAARNAIGFQTKLRLEPVLYKGKDTHYYAFTRMGGIPEERYSLMDIRTALEELQGADEAALTEYRAAIG